MDTEDLKAKIREIIDAYWAVPMEDPEDIDALIADREDAEAALVKIADLVK